MSINNLIEYKTFFYTTSQLNIREFFMNGKREGERLKWYSTGQLRERSFYKDGKLDGKYNKWYACGCLEYKEFYVNGHLEGKRTVWWCSHIVKYRPRFIENYRNGKLEGEYITWDDYGQSNQHFYTATSLDHHFYIDNRLVDSKFTVHKKHNWINRLKKFRYKIKLEKFDSALNNFIPLDLIKICANY